MDFLNSLSQVAKNQKNFKTWEEEQANNNAQRQELAQRRQYSKAELDAAKQLGETIIDVVDIMDNHSENVAENVETATQPLVAIAPFATLMASGWGIGKHVIKPAYDKIWDIQKQHFWDNKNASELAKKITEDIHKKRPNKRDFYEWDFTSKKRVDAIRNSELKKQALELHNAYQKEIKSYLRKTKGGFWAIAALTLASFVGANIYASSLQVGSSKIARYQARKILDDPKAFVKYTPEQIAQAKEYIEAHPELKKEKKKDKLKGGLFRSIVNVIKDRKEYKKAKLADTDVSKKVTRTLSPEELKQAQKDQEVIQRSVRIINNEAEKYSENMEVAAGVIMGSTPIVGGFFGWLTGLVMNKTGVTDKIINNTVEKYGSADAKAAFARFKEVKVGGPGYTVRWSKFFDAMMEDTADNKKVAGELVDNVAKKSVKNNKLDKIGRDLKKLFAAGLSHKWGNAKLIGLIGAVVSAIPAALIALKLQKSAARAGRYTAKRELEKEPSNFIGYTEEDYNEVKDVKGKKQTFGQKVKELALFVPTVLKQYYAYDKYKRTEFKDHQLLRDQLQKSENITDEQLQDAKNLQRKLFNTFEKVDDNSQIYSESMEAAVEIAQPIALNLGILAMLSPAIYTGVQIKRGKISAATILESVTGKLAKASEFLKSKTFKKYLDNVTENVSHKVGNVDLQNKPLAKIFSGIDFSKDTVGVWGEKLFKNIHEYSKDFRKMSDYEQCEFIGKLEKTLTDVKDNFDLEEPMLDKLINGVKCLRSHEISSSQRADLLDFFTANKDAVYAMSDTQLRNIQKNMSRLDWEANGGEKAMRETLDEIFEHPDEYPDFLRKYGLYRNWFDKEKFLEAELGEFSRERMLGGYDLMIDGLGMLFNKETMNFKLKETPKYIDEKVELLKRFFRGEVNLDESNLLDGKTTGKGAESFSEKLMKKLSLKGQVQHHKEKFAKMTDEEFQDYMDARRFSSMNKATMMKVLDNLDKIVDNIPQEQIDKVLGRIYSEFQKNPDEVMKLVTSGKIAQIFMTKGVVNTAAALGVSWVALNVGLTWAIQSWLADMQLKAGRLGVMKAMESLDDPTYYANVEPDKKQIAQSQTVSDTQTPPQTIKPPVKGNLLDKYRK